MKIAVSNRASSFEALAAQARAQVRWADLVELRLDGALEGAAKLDPEALARLVRELAKPVIVALNGPEAFGSFRGSPKQRFEILRAAARAGAAWVDVDARFASGLGALACPRIVSRHELQATPAAPGVHFRELAHLALPGDVLKLVAHADSAEDGLRMLAAVRAQPGACVGFCSGEVGRFTRELCCAFGSSWTYAAPAGQGEATAPGQVRADELRALWPRGDARGSTRFLGVIGRPARHSFSPQLFNAEISAEALDAIYGFYEAADFGAFWRALPDEHFAGFSVTAPFKQAALEVCASLDDTARATAPSTRSCAWVPAGTAPTPTSTACAPRSATSPANARWSSAPAAPRAAVFALVSDGAEVRVAAREGPRAAALGAECGVPIVRWETLADERCDVLVHCTPMGSLAEPGILPVPLECLREGMRVLDAVYRPSETPLVAAARAQGCEVIPGTEWFLEQAAAQFSLFTGHEPDRARLRHRLAELSR